MDLLNILKTNENTRKIFGKRELKIIEKQLLSIKLTQSEKNRLSRDIRKKFEFIKDVTKFSEEFDIKKGMIIKEIVKEAKESILNSRYFKNIKKIILYGSVVEDKMTFKSDIDIAVEFFSITLSGATLFRKEIMGKVNKRIDIQVYNYLPNKIKVEVDHKGKVLYKNEDKR